ncbi:tRNA_int_endo domain-containing protein [Haematococcus lacustris]|uniref:tRNA_int_endo domain-containing protein n=1 Tax=Haematococcus lacustris TaxID=44745 RepID=A0A699ZK48_HAELA|nr:tRNA_int_endo domain-containing protein [Haematococcus lacustris]
MIATRNSPEAKYCTLKHDCSGVNGTNDMQPCHAWRVSQRAGGVGQDGGGDEPYEGWLPRSGLLYGVDWVLYPLHPKAAHSAFSVKIMPLLKEASFSRVHNHMAGVEELAWHDFQITSRVAGTVGGRGAGGCGEAHAGLPDCLSSSALSLAAPVIAQSVFCCEMQHEECHLVCQHTNMSGPCTRSQAPLAAVPVRGKHQPWLACTSVPGAHEGENADPTACGA